MYTVFGHGQATSKLIVSLFLVGFIPPEVVIRKQESVGAVNVTVGLISAKLCGQIEVSFSIDNTSNATGETEFLISIDCGISMPLSFF